MRAVRRAFALSRRVAPDLEASRQRERIDRWRLDGIARSFVRTTIRTAGESPRLADRLAYHRAATCRCVHYPVVGGHGYVHPGRTAHSWRVCGTCGIVCRRLQYLWVHAWAAVRAACRGANRRSHAVV